MDHARIKRAQQIKDSEVKVQQETTNHIRAMVKEHHILIDLENHMIIHENADWSKTLPSKRFCKHLGKLLLTIDKEKAATILRQIHSAKDQYKFKPYAGQKKSSYAKFKTSIPCLYQAEPKFK